MQLTRNLMVECVSRLNPSSASCIGLRATVAEAVEQLRRENVGCLVVVDDGELVGVFTERDLLKKVLIVGGELSTPVSAVMTANPVSVNVNDSIRSAVERMQNGGYRHLPVVDEGQQPVGILSAKHVVQYLAEQIPATLFHRPPDPQQLPATPDGA